MFEKIVQLNEEVIKGQIKELVRGSVEETLNELLEQEAEKLTQAARYERNEARQGYRSGHYDRNLTTTSGDVTLHVPRLKGVSFETAIIEWYRRRESSVEEALIEMYLAGVSVRRVEDITEALWGSKVSPATISELNKKAYTQSDFQIVIERICDGVNISILAGVSLTLLVGDDGCVIYDMVYTNIHGQFVVAVFSGTIFENIRTINDRAVGMHTTLMRGVLFADMQNYDIPKLHITSDKKTLYMAGAFYIIEQVPLTEIHGF